MLKNSPKRKYTFCIQVEHLRCPPCWTNYMCEQFKLHVTGACRQWRERERESSHERKRGKVPDYSVLDQGVRELEVRAQFVPSDATP